MAEENLNRLAVSLPRYDGPFDLLLVLIRRNEYPIDALPVREITGQFLAYVKTARDLDAELGGEFVEVASWLVLLLSRSMLPPGKHEGPAPREELRRAVLDHRTLLAATEWLRERGGKSRPGSAGARAGREESESDQEEAPTVLDLLDAAQRALEAARAARSLEGAGAASATVEEMMRWIRIHLAAIPPDKAVSTREWFRNRADSEAGAALLLALLEMAGKGALLLHQGEDFGPIRVKAAGAVAEHSGGGSRQSPALGGAVG